MNREEIGRRIETLWRPYHDTIDVEIERHLACGVRPYLLSVHSFTPELLGERRDFDIGVLFSVYDEDACAFARIAEAQGLRTRLNAPYSGRRSEIYSVAHHALTHALPFLELEVNQALLGSASGAGDVGRTLARVSALMLADRGP
jgi:predicted N-formylglutamate amidohydrolase